MPSASREAATTYTVPRPSTAVDGSERLRNASPANGALMPVMPAIGTASDQSAPRFVDFACMRALSWLSYHVA